jgi:hypothetical protein
MISIALAPIGRLGSVHLSEGSTAVMVHKSTENGARIRAKINVS